MFDIKEIAKKVVSLIRKHNMTQMESEDKTDIGYQTGLNLEKGNGIPDINKFQQMRKENLYV